MAVTSNGWIPTAQSDALSTSAISGANPSLLCAAMSSRKPRASSYTPGSPLPPGTLVPRLLARLHTDALAPAHFHPPETMLHSPPPASPPDYTGCPGGLGLSTHLPWLGTCFLCPLTGLKERGLHWEPEAQVPVLPRP